MRFIIALTMVLGIMAGFSALPAPGWANGGAVVTAQEQPASPGKVDVDIDVNRGSSAWWMSPTWLAIGAIALVLLIVIVAMVARGGGTTIIKE